MKITNDDTRDIALRCVDSMFEHNLLDSKYYEQDDEFIIQDIIHNEINKALNIKEDECEKCEGTGHDIFMEGDGIICPKCNGTGEVK